MHLQTTYSRTQNTTVLKDEDTKNMTSNAT